MNNTFYMHGPYAPSVVELAKETVQLRIDAADGSADATLFFDTPEDLLVFTDQIEAQTRAVMGARGLLKN